MYYIDSLFETGQGKHLVDELYKVSDLCTSETDSDITHNF